nr:uncharacterized protein CTRU02_03926 [Colletotrichum truncatum]KAF6795966.1 hypothetical protein CTRU02_03926 [Colletotrichum truncatum]
MREGRRRLWVGASYGDDGGEVRRDGYRFLYGGITKWTGVEDGIKRHPASVEGGILPRYPYLQAAAAVPYCKARDGRPRAISKPSKDSKARSILHYIPMPSMRIPHPPVPDQTSDKQQQHIQEVPSPYNRSVLLEGAWRRTARRTGQDTLAGLAWQRWEAIGGLRL